MMGDFIQFYVSEGLNIIPIKFRNKTPLVEWSRYQSERITDEEIEKWFSGDVGINIAIVCGRISGNLVVVDFDDPRAYKKLFSGIDRETIVVKTGRGFHVYFRADYPVNSFAIIFQVSGESTSKVREVMFSRLLRFTPTARRTSSCLNAPSRAGQAISDLNFFNSFQRPSK